MRTGQRPRFAGGAFLAALLLFSSSSFRAFAWTALAVGFGIVLWILYAMLFAYR